MKEKSIEELKAEIEELKRAVADRDTQLRVERDTRYETSQERCEAREVACLLFKDLKEKGMMGPLEEKASQKAWPWLR